MDTDSAARSVSSSWAAWARLAATVPGSKWTEGMLVDCGMMFPDPEMLGVDLVLPDFTYIIENKDRLEGCVLTHGHEDHVGALAYLLQRSEHPDIRFGGYPRPRP